MATITRSRIPEMLAKHPEFRPRLIALVDECIKGKRAAHARIRLPEPFNPTNDIALIKATYSTKKERGVTTEAVLLTPATTQDEVDMIAWDERRKGEERVTQ